MDVVCGPLLVDLSWCPWGRRRHEFCDLSGVTADANQQGGVNDREARGVAVSSRHSLSKRLHLTRLELLLVFQVPIAALECITDTDRLIDRHR